MKLIQKPERKIRVTFSLDKSVLENFDKIKSKNKLNPSRSLYLNFVLKDFISYVEKQKQED